MARGEREASVYSDESEYERRCRKRRYRGDNGDDEYVPKRPRRATPEPPSSAGRATLISDTATSTTQLQPSRPQCHQFQTIAASRRDPKPDPRILARQLVSYPSRQQFAPCTSRDYWTGTLPRAALYEGCTVSLIAHPALDSKPTPCTIQPRPRCPLQ